MAFRQTKRHFTGPARKPAPITDPLINFSKISLDLARTFLSVNEVIILLIYKYATLLQEVALIY